MDSPRTSENNQDNGDENAFIAIGEVRSEQDGQLASVTLFEMGIPCELTHVGSEVDEIRRFLGSWSTGQKLFVKPQDAARALAAVSPRLEPMQIWTDTTLFLEQCTTEHLLKLLDFRAIWREPCAGLMLCTAERMLAARGIDYPPDGASKRLPTLCLILSALFGPLGTFIMRGHIDKMRTTKEGGTRPCYNEKTRHNSDRCLIIGLVTWCVLFLLVILILKALIPPPRGNQASQRTVSIIPKPMCNWFKVNPPVRPTPVA